MALEIYNAFVKAGVPESEAKAAVESINKEIDKRYVWHASQLFTKADGAELEARLLRAMAEMQRWTLTAIFAAFGIAVALIKFL